MSESKGNAFGAIETFGLVWVLEAGDAMCKAGDVNLIGYENTASGYISILVEGVEALGAEVYSSVVIPRPHPDLKKITDRYRLENLLPY